MDFKNFGKNITYVDSTHVVGMDSFRFDMTSPGLALKTVK